ncbi:MAG: MFS transporter [Alphaproteobacteria bacterium]|nr:MFS transporter [Alphaproteobacteria bacterium]
MGRPALPLLAARALRDFGDSFVAVLLPVYLIGRGLTPFEVGVVSTVSLLGSAALTLGVGFVGARFGTRRLLIAASCLMTATGLAFAGIEGYWPLLLIAFAGTVNPSAGSASVFASLEQAALAAVADAQGRTRLFANYSLVGSLASALGALAAAAPDLAGASGIDRTTAIDAMFVVYALLGVAGGFLYSRLPVHAHAGVPLRQAALGPSRGIVVRLAALFSLDSFAGGFVVQSLLALWLFERFGLSLAEAGAFFFWSGLLSAASFPIAARLAGRIGLVNTMVWTHIPASAALMLAAIVPSLPVAMALLLLRAFLSQMDVPTRSSYVMAVVTEAERPAAASFTAVPRSLASAISPAIAGALFAAALPALPLLLCGGLKILYDLLLLRQFRHVRPPEER